MAQPQQQQQQAPPQPPPLTAEQQALNDAHFSPIPFTIDPKTSLLSTPTSHDLGITNVLSRMLASMAENQRQQNPAAVASGQLAALPPPPNVIPPQRSLAVNQAREQGKEAFKRKEYSEAIKLFTLAIDMAASRPLWEMAALARDELAVCLANRSAAFAAVEDWVDSLVDADAVVQLKRPWLKGHYRKGVALSKMGRYEEAREALRLGLQFDPESPVSRRREKGEMMTMALTLILLAGMGTGPAQGPLRGTDLGRRQKQQQRRQVRLSTPRHAGAGVCLPSGSSITITHSVIIASHFHHDIASTALWRCCC